MNQKRVLAVAGLLGVIAAAALPSSARAAEIGFYIGGLYGQTDKELLVRDFDVFATSSVLPTFGFTPSSFTSTMDDSFTAYGFFGGYRFTKHFAVEGGYLNVGTFKYRARAMGAISNVPSTAVVNYDGETTGMNVAAIGVWPMSYRWEIYGRAGALFSTNTASVYYADIQGPARTQFSESDVDVLAGVGTSFTVLEIYDLRLEYQRVFDAGDESIGEGDADTISLGISVVF